MHCSYLRSSLLLLIALMLLPVSAADVPVGPSSDTVHATNYQIKC